ncbi:MAG: amidohydrolase family protein [Gemmatimonadota bacterium]
MSAGPERRTSGGGRRITGNRGAGRRFPCAAPALALLCAGGLLGTAPLAAQQADTWDVTQARGRTTQVDFTTDEGTWMSLDVSPDGQWIVFDLLAQIYRVPIAGGTAELLTQDAGVSTNYHPRWSPDGSMIAFVSDRGGQNNLWVMDADGSNPRAVLSDQSARFVEPVWSPDGRYIVVRRQPLPEPGQNDRGGLWMVHRDGGKGVSLTTVAGASWPSFDPTGAHIYFTRNEGGNVTIGYGDALKGYRQLARLELATGEVVPITAGTAQQQIRASSGGAYAGEVSPDGRWLAFARRIPDGTITWKGHTYGPRTALWLRDLQTGAERVIMDPIESDMTETIKTLRVLPGYDWTPDGSAIVINQGGKIRRLDVATGNVGTIEFSARVQRTVSEQTRADFRIGDGAFPVKFTRWHAASPDGRRVAFQAVGRIWLKDLPDGTPRRLTPEGFEPMEYSPAWSPDGRWIAFTTWEEPATGHVWKIRTDGRGRPEQVSTEPAEYIHPVWSEDGTALIVARGGGATQRGRGWAWTPWHELVRIPAAGGAATFVAREATGPEGEAHQDSRRQIVRASVAQGRIHYPEVDESEGARGRTALVSVRPDGSDKRTHATFPYADEVVMSPDGRNVAFQEGDNVYLAPLPAVGTGSDAVHVAKRNGALPVTQLSTEGGLFPTWLDANTLTFGNADRFFMHHVREASTDTFSIAMQHPRATPTGVVALTGARIVTLEDQARPNGAAGVIERGVLVVDGARIRCVGQVGACEVSDADSVVDLNGGTIIPGFVDMHAHHYREHRGIIPAHSYEQAVYLAYGVTTNLDNSMWSQNVFPTAELIEAGMVIGPRTYSTGDPLYRGDGGRQNDLRTQEVAEQNVARLASWGATGIKQYLQPRRDQRQWVSEAARKRGLMVTAEGSDLAYNLSMILDGQTGWEHPMSYVVTYGDVHKFFGRTHSVYSPTWVVGGTGPWNEEFFFAESNVWQKDKQRRFMPWRQTVPHQQRRMLRPEEHYGFPMISQTLFDIVAEGGWGAIGSHGQAHGIGSHWEVWMAAAAFGPLGALEVASKHGAHFLGAEQDIGTLAPGKLADLMVLNANPLDDIRNTEDIRYVMKGGRMWEGDTLDQVWPARVPFGPYYWNDEAAQRQDSRPVR